MTTITDSNYVKIRYLGELVQRKRRAKIPYIVNFQKYAIPSFFFSNTGKPKLNEGGEATIDLSRVPPKLLESGKIILPIKSKIGSRGNEIIDQYHDLPRKALEEYRERISKGKEGL